MAGSRSRTEAMQLARTLRYLKRQALEQAQTQAAAQPQVQMPSLATVGKQVATAAVKDKVKDVALSQAAEAAPTFMGNLGALGTGPQTAIALATLMTAKGIKDLAQGKKSDLPTRGVTAMSTFGFSELARALGVGGDKDRWKTEQGRGQKLAEKGVTGWDQLMAAAPKLTKGRSKDELTRKDLAADFVGKDPQGVWVNNKFAQSRNEADLKPEDIWGYSAFGEAFGNDWLGKYSEDQRRQIAQKALDSGKVRERMGTIDIGDVDSLKAFASTLPPAQQKTTGQGTRDKQGAPSGKKRASGKFPLAELPPLVSPTMPETDPKIADAYKRIFEENQGVSGNAPWRDNPWLNILRR